MRFSERLRELGACRTAWRWVEQRGFGLKKAWDHCGNEGWMFWWLWTLEDEGVSIPLSRLKKEFLALVKGKESRVLVAFRRELREAMSANDVFNATIKLDIHFDVVWSTEDPFPSKVAKMYCDAIRRAIPKAPVMPVEGSE